MRVVTTDAAVFLEVPQGWLVKMAGCVDSTLILDPDHTWPFSAVNPAPASEPVPAPTPQPSPAPVPVPPVPAPVPVPAPMPAPVPVPLPVPMPMPLPVPLPLPDHPPAPAPASSPFEGAVKEAVFDGKLAAGWANYSWATQSIIKDPTGALAIQTDLSDFKGENLHYSMSKNLADYVGLSFDCEELMPGGSYRVSLYDGTALLGTGKMVTPTASYATFQFTLQDMGILAMGAFSNIVMEGVSQGTRSPFLIKNINLWKRNSSASMPVPTPMPTPMPMPSMMAPAPATMGWLTINSMGKFVDESGKIWVGKGVNFIDFNQANAASGVPLDKMLPEMKRRLDWAVQTLKIDFIRYCIDQGTTGVLGAGSAYLVALQDIVTYAWQKHNVRVLLSLWNEVTLEANSSSSAHSQGPTVATVPVWTYLTQAFARSGHVLFGLCNEPESTAAINVSRWRMAMEACGTAIRNAEMTAGVMKSHIVVLQNGAYARNLADWKTHPINIAGPVAFEYHDYQHAGAWQNAWVQYASMGMPLIIGEWGPAVIQSTAGLNASDYNSLTLPDADYWSLPREQAPLYALIKQNQVPCAAWSLSCRAWPDLLKDNTNGGAGVGMMLELSEWGKMLQMLYTSG